MLLAAPRMLIAAFLSFLFFLFFFFPLHVLQKIAIKCYCPYKLEQKCYWCFFLAFFSLIVCLKVEKFLKWFLHFKNLVFLQGYVKHFVCTVYSILVVIEERILCAVSQQVPLLETCYTAFGISFLGLMHTGCA